MNFELTILGSNSATPAFDRHPTSQLLNIRNKYFLLDCGEGTQMQLIRYKLKYHRISDIFISHLHGDHYLGLMGLLSTMHLQGRTADMHIHGHPELMDAIELQLRLSHTVLRYNLIFHPLRTFAAGIVYEDNDIMVRSVELNHRIPCMGFVFYEKRSPRKILMDKVQEYQIPVNVIDSIKHGEDYAGEGGKVIPNEELTIPSPEPRSYAFLSDTKYDEYLVDQIKDVDLLYHEATFTEELRERAEATFHSTASQAGKIAKMANVGKLLIGHFSARYKELDTLLAEARSEFENTELAIEGTTFELPIKKVLV